MKPNEHTKPAPHYRTPIESRFTSVRNSTLRLIANLSAEDCCLQSMPDASPVKWHLAHTSWFFETFILEKFEPDFKPFDPSFKVLFNSYYNGVGDKHPRAERGLISRPDLQSVLAYRRNITERMMVLLAADANSANDTEFLKLAWLGCNHEEQHQELILTDLKHLLSKNPLKPPYQSRWPLTPVESRNKRWHRFDGGLIEVGFEGEGFRFDNESPRHKTYLMPFELASHPVTHGDFAAFIADGGYQRAELWLSLGWDWVNTNRIEAPLYWEKRGGESKNQRDGKWFTFTLHGMMEIDDHTPICHISFFEADAYARWKNARLPSEAEWEHAAAFALSGNHQTKQEANFTQSLQAGNFLETNALHPLALREETSQDHPQQLFGDVWEWTGSAYLGYPGYAPEAGAVGEYNGKFMCNQFVLRGGSCATPKQHIRASYRNFFPPDARWQFSGFRLARNVT